MKRAATSESGGVIDLTNDTDDDNNETKDSSSKKPDRDKDNDEPKSKKLKKETEQHSKPSGSKPNNHVSSSKQQDKRTFHSNYHGSSSSRERQWIQMGWNPQRNNRTMPPFGRGGMHVQQPRRPLPQHQHSPTPPLMAMDFPAADVFSHPSDQFRVGPCPDPDTFRPLIGRAVTIFGEGPCYWKLCIF